MPIALRANWIFRIAALDPVTRYTAAIRRTFLLLAVAPVCSCFAVATLLLWQWKVAAPHLLMLALLGSILASISAWSASGRFPSPAPTGPAVPISSSPSGERWGCCL